jgi:hypothetical protein
MRTLAYKILPAVGPGSIKKTSRLPDLLFDIPYLLSSKLIPPLYILNDLLRTGVLDAGMSGGCRWKPFAISAEEYHELLEELITKQEDTFTVVEVPDWVKTYHDWGVWTLEYLRGVPAKEYLVLQQEVERAQERLNEARRSGDTDLENIRLNEVMAANQRWSDFLLSYLNKQE